MIAALPAKVARGDRVEFAINERQQLIHRRLIAPADRAQERRNLAQLVHSFARIIPLSPRQPEQIRPAMCRLQQFHEITRRQVTITKNPMQQSGPIVSPECTGITVALRHHAEESGGCL